MNKTNLLELGLLMMATLGMTGCGTCPNGQEVVIPSSDTSTPSVVMDIYLPSGYFGTVTPSSPPPTVAVPGGGTVTVVARATDPQGVRDAQIWAASIIRTSTSVSGPGLLGRPTANNSSSGTPGQTGCTERRISQELEVSRSPQGGSVSYEVKAQGVNFGGAVVSTPLVTVHAQ